MSTAPNLPLPPCRPEEPLLDTNVVAEITTRPRPARLSSPGLGLFQLLPSI